MCECQFLQWGWRRHIQRYKEEYIGVGWYARTWVVGKSVLFSDHIVLTLWLKIMFSDRNDVISWCDIICSELGDMTSMQCTTSGLLLWMVNESMNYTKVVMKDHWGCNTPRHSYNRENLRQDLKGEEIVFFLLNPKIEAIFALIHLMCNKGIAEPLGLDRKNLEVQKWIFFPSAKSLALC